MNFFNSVFSDDPDPPKSEPDSPKTEQQDHPDPNSPQNQHTPKSNPNPSGGWSFGGLIQTLATKSESVIDIYRRDLQEFGSGLKKEIEVAQGSIGTVQHAIDEYGSSVLKGTAQIISQGKDAILAVDLDSDSSDNNNTNNPNYSNQKSLDSKKYSRFDAQVRAIQGDTSTYCEEPEDLEDYNEWNSGFLLEEKSEQIEGLFGDNGNMESIYKRVVPSSVDHETFWCRYFYKVRKLKEAEDVRAKIVKRAISREDEEELSWDVDDDEEEEDESNTAPKANLVEKREVGSGDFGKNVKNESSVENSLEVREKNVNVEEIGNDDEKNNVALKESENKELGGKDSEQIVKEENSVGESRVGSAGVVDEKNENVSNVENEAKGIVVESSSGDVSDEKVHSEKNLGINKEDSVLKSDEKVAFEGKAESGESSKNSDFSVVSSQPSVPEDEDLGWDEIEDLSSIDEKKATHVGSPNRADLRKRLSTAEDEEDLSWDIEDDDEPAKA